MIGVCGASVLIDDLTLVFGVISGVSECLIIFILPSIFYLLADKMAVKRALEAKNNTESQASYQGISLFTKICIYAYASIGAAYFVTSNYYNFAKIFRAAEAEV